MGLSHKVGMQVEHNSGSERTEAAPAGYSPEPAKHILMLVQGYTEVTLPNLLSAPSRAQCRVIRLLVTSFPNDVE